MIRRWRGDEAGAVAVITALTLSILLLFASFAIDLAQLRVDRAAGQLAADLGASAAAAVYDPRVPATAAEACENALSYTLANLGRSSATPLGPGCASLAGQPACTGGTFEYEAQPFQIRITIGVADGSPLMQGMDHGLEYDGVDCERIGVEVFRPRDFLLAGAGGASTTSGSTDMSAVARSSLFGVLGDYASLVVLQRTGCETLSAKGQGFIEVKGVDGVDDQGQPTRFPGIIAVDTAPQGCTSSGDGEVIYVNPTASAKIFAEDRMENYGLRLPTTNRAHVYNASYVPAKISPQPVGALRTTRSIVDYKVNCLGNYGGSNATEAWSPSNTTFSIGAIDGCDTSQAGNGSYIKPLHDALQSLATPQSSVAASTNVAALNSAGWAVFPDNFDDKNCNNKTSLLFGPTHLANLLPAVRTAYPQIDGRRVYLNCSDGGQALSPGTSSSPLRFEGVEVVLSRNEISMGNAHRFEIVGDAAKGAVLYFQRGGIKRNGGVLDLRGTFVYVENGVMSLSGSGSVVWRGPSRAVHGPSCNTYSTGIPPAGCFAPLALWSNLRTTNNQTQNTMGGGAAIDLEGSFFSPNATFNMSGNTSYTLDKAQFISATLENTGQGNLTMITNPNSSFETPRTSGGLIR